MIFFYIFTVCAMVVKCWASIAGSGPTLRQHRLNVCLMRYALLSTVLEKPRTPNLVTDVINSEFPRAQTQSVKNSSSIDRLRVTLGVRFTSQAVCFSTGYRNVKCMDHKMSTISSAHLCI